MTYNLQFLEEKLGPFQKEYQYPTKPISGFNLIYIETQTKKELDETVKKVKEQMNPGYIWGYVKDSDAIYVTRAFGENKIFIYNPTTIKKTDYVKGKLKVLNNLSKNSINDLFDQKAVFDYFYRKLWDLRLDLGKELRDKNNLSDNKSLMAAQHIIDRIIFTYFICEKNLVTLNGETPLDSRTLFSSISKMPEPWGCLKNLFFEQFAKKKSSPLLLGKNAQIVTPYLNGGLFRPKKIGEISEIDLKIGYTKEQWQKLFEPFNKYTWIIEDEIPDHEGEYEGNLTPEIIGHIYEKFVISIETLEEINLDDLNISSKGDLKKGNKKIGAYYTPEYITEYISRKTITPHILEKLGIKEELEFDDLVNNNDTKTLKKILEIIDELTICDPACGSGAFLIKAGEILLEYKVKILKQTLEGKINRYNLKKQIIVNNLHGVDIQEGAVEICKLRLWLWLISSADSKKVEALPNIEYNFRVGNALIGWFDENLSQISIDNPLNDEIKGIFKGLIAVADEEDEKLLERAELLLKGYNLEKYIESYYLIYTIYRKSDGRKAEKLKNIIEEIRLSIYNSINLPLRDYLNKKIKPNYNKNKPPITEDLFLEFLPFHWKIDFGQILKNGGFDILIGNPPYIRNRELKIAEKKVLNTYKSADGQYDIYQLFFERSISLIKNKAYLGFITSNKYAIASYGKKLRKLILDNNKIVSILDVSNIDVFKEVSTYPYVIILKKESNEDLRNKNLIKISKIESEDDIKTETNKHINQRIFLENKDNLFNIRLDKNKIALIKKLMEQSIPLGDITVIKETVHTGNIRDKLIKTSEINSKTKKLLRGKDCQRYYKEWNNLWILTDQSIIDKSKKEYATIPNNSFFEQSKLFLREIANQITACYDDEGYYSLNKAYVINRKDENFDLKYILGLINSRLLSWFYRVNFESAHVRGGYLQFKIQYTAQIPIKVCSELCQQSIINLVDDMILLNNQKIDIINLYDEFLVDSPLNNKLKSLNYYINDKNCEDYFIDNNKIEYLIDEKKTALIRNYKIFGTNNSIILSVGYADGSSEDVIKVEFKNPLYKEFFYESIFKLINGKTKSYKTPKNVLKSVLNDIKIPWSSKSDMENSKEIKVLMNHITLAFEKLLISKYKKSKITELNLSKISNEIVDIDLKIDKAVNEVYGLNDNEIRIIKGE